MERPDRVEIGVGDRIISLKGETVVTDPSHPPKVAKIVEHEGREVLHALSGSSLVDNEIIIKTNETWPPERVSQALIDGHAPAGLPPRNEEQQEEMHQLIRENHAKGTIWVPGEHQK